MGCYAARRINIKPGERPQERNERSSSLRAAGDCVHRRGCAEVVRFAARHAGSRDDRRRAVRLYYQRYLVLDDELEVGREPGVRSGNDEAHADPANRKARIGSSEGREIGDHFRQPFVEDFAAAGDVGKQPATPALYIARTKGGKETRNIGAPITGARSLTRKRAGKRDSLIPVSPIGQGLPHDQNRNTP